MAEVKVKNITYVSELECMGTQNGTVDANSASKFVPPNFSSLKQFIIDFNNFIEYDLGLSRVGDSDQIDINNLSFIDNLHDIQTYMKALNTYEKFMDLMYGYNIFAFNDSLQDTKPLYLKFEYNLTNICPKSSNTGHYPRFAFSIKFSLIDALTNTVILTERLCNGNARNLWSAPSSISLTQTLKSSFGFYNDNALYINIMPKKSFSWVGNGTSIPTTESPYINFYLERKENYIKFINMSKFRESPTNGQDPALNSTNTNISYYGYSSQIFNSTSGIYIPYNSQAIKITNNQFPCFKTIDIDLNTNAIEDSDKVMVTYTGQTSNIDYQVVDIKQSNGDIKKYMINNHRDNIYFIGRADYSLMFRID